MINITASNTLLVQKDLLTKDASYFTIFLLNSKIYLLHYFWIPGSAQKYYIVDHNKCTFIN